jgi:hypothetical protein
MTHHTALILRVHVPSAAHEVGDEIGQVALVEAIATQADQIADKPGTDLLAQPNDACHEALRAHVVTEMTAALTHAASTYTAPRTRCASRCPPGRSIGGSDDPPHPCREDPARRGRRDHPGIPGDNLTADGYTVVPPWSASSGLATTGPLKPTRRLYTARIRTLLASARAAGWCLTSDSPASRGVSARQLLSLPSATTPWESQERIGGQVSVAPRRTRTAEYSKKSSV